MAEPFLAEIRIMSFNYAPRGWAMCNGQFLPINQNQPLFSLLGTTFGGNGRTNFALPNLQGRTPIHVGNTHNLGDAGGEQVHTLSISELPTHTHAFSATTAAATVGLPGGNLAAAPPVTDPLYSDATNLTAMGPSAIASTGGSQAHQNMQPFLTLTFCIALQGIFPSPN
jgi:microcystin-dependent protein